MGENCCCGCAWIVDYVIGELDGQVGRQGGQGEQGGQVRGQVGWRLNDAWCVAWKALLCTLMRIG